MLTSLSISNYALIDELNITLNNGFSVITGETGAGKSIILGALGLIMGARNDSSALKDQDKKCVVEATFNIEGYGLENLFTEYDIDYEPITSLRREVLSNGKSRAFINDTPINLTVLKDVAEKLIDIHSQHQNLMIANPKFQLDVVDAVANTKGDALKYRANFIEYKKLINSRNELIASVEKQKADEEYIRFQLEQLTSAKLIEEEQSELESELEQLTHAEEIKSNLTQTLLTLNETDFSTLTTLKDSQNTLKKIATFLHNGSNYMERFESLIIELKDLITDFEAINEKIVHNPERQAEVTNRLTTIYSLQKKHHVSSIKELLSIQKDFEAKLNSIQNFDQEIEALNKEITSKFEHIKLEASTLSQKRSNHFKSIEKTIVNQLKELSIPNAEFIIENNCSPQPSENGYDEPLFLFSANKNGKLGEVSKVASGGEISRFMLCIKALLSDAKGLPTIIFDEIDTGVSGEVAEKMGQIMVSMSKQIQVISITHLPQIASKGDYHFKVFKQDNEHSTQTNVINLNDNDRINEIAKMLSGKNLTDAAISNARELLKRSH